MEVKAVIGANWGDEGKGLVTAHLSKEARQKGTVLNVLYNGGFQRGHTVHYENQDIVFHTMGAGTPYGADTYYTEDFILEPLTFLEERDKIKHSKSIFFAHQKCRITTPFDIYLGQKREREVIHGSCGMGIYQTIKRHELISLYFWELGTEIEFITRKLLAIGQTLLNEGWLTKEEVEKIFLYEINSFIAICKKFYGLITEVSSLKKLWSYDTIIFEGGQGLAISQLYFDKEINPHCTPSFTGSQNICKILPKDIPVDVYYVSRTYATRHGNGELLGECQREDLGVPFDQTNQFNIWQGELRYGILNWQDMIARIANDGVPMGDRFIRRNLVFTHADKTNGEIMTDTVRGIPLHKEYLGRILGYFRIWKSENNENMMLLSD